MRTSEADEAHIIEGVQRVSRDVVSAATHLFQTLLVISCSSALSHGIARMQNRRKHLGCAEKRADEIGAYLSR